MINTSSLHSGVRYTVLSAAPLLSLFLILCLLLSGNVFAESGEGICLLAINDSELDNAGCGLGETLLGDIYADAVREAAGADIALVRAGVFSAERLTHGMVYAEDITLSLASDDRLVMAEVTAAGLKAVLEDAVSAIVLDMETEAVLREDSYSEGFVQISGFTIICDASAPAGSRIMTIAIDGDELNFADEETRFNLAADEGTLSRYTVGGDTGLTLSEALMSYLPSLDGMTQYPTGRISIVGTTDNKLIDNVPVWAVAFAAVFFTLAALLVHRAKEQE